MPNPNGSAAGRRIVTEQRVDRKAEPAGSSRESPAQRGRGAIARPPVRHRKSANEVNALPGVASNRHLIGRVGTVATPRSRTNWLLSTAGRWRYHSADFCAFRPTRSLPVCVIFPATKSRPKNEEGFLGSRGAIGGPLCRLPIASLFRWIGPGSAEKAAPPAETLGFDPSRTSHLAPGRELYVSRCAKCHSDAHRRLRGRRLDEPHHSPNGAEGQAESGRDKRVDGLRCRSPFDNATQVSSPSSRN